MSDRTARLHYLLQEAGIPYSGGISYPDRENKDTWVIGFSDAATPAQKTAAALILQTLDNPDVVARHKSQEQESRYLSLRAEHGVLTFCGMLVRSRNIPAWDKMSVQQKIDAIMAEIVAYVAVRRIVESNITTEEE